MGNLNYTKTGLLLFIIGTLITLLSLIPVLFFLQDITNIGNMVNLMVTGIFSFVGLILYLIGYIFMCIGGIYFKEYGEKHKKFLIYSIIFLIVLIVLVVIQAVYQSFVIYSAVSTTGDFSGISYIFYFSIPVAVMSGLFYLFLLHELENKIGKIILYTAFITSIVISIITAYMIASNFDTLMSSILEAQSSGGFQSATSLSQNFSSEITKYGALGIIPNTLWLVAMILPFYRMHTGKFPMNDRPARQYNYQNQNNNVCPKCGAQFSPGTQFCENCGYRFY